MSPVEENVSEIQENRNLTQSSNDLITRTRHALRELLRLVDERSKSEQIVTRDKTTGEQAIEFESSRARQEISTKRAALESNLKNADEQRRRAIIDEALQGEAEAKSEFGKSSRRIAADFDALKQRAVLQQQKDNAEAKSAFEAGEREATVTYGKARKPIDDASKIASSFRARLDRLYDDYHRFGLPEPSEVPTRENYHFEDPVEALFERLTKIEKPIKYIEGLAIPKAMKGKRSFWLILVVFLILVFPMISMLDELPGAGMALALGVVGGIALRFWLFGIAKQQVSRDFYPVFQSVVDAEALGQHCRARVDGKLASDRERVALLREDLMQQARIRQAKTVSTGESLRDERLREINDKYAKRMVDIQTKQQIDLRAAIETHEKQVVEMGEKHAAGLTKVEEKIKSLREKVATRYDTSYKEMSERWHKGVADLKQHLDAIYWDLDRFGPSFQDPAWNDRPCSALIPQVIRFGSVRVDLAAISGGISDDSRLMEDVPRVFDFPALRSFSQRPNLVIDTPAEGRSAAIEALQAGMLRLFTSLPPGALRFTIVDPMGIGRNFGAYMHLADYDDALINGQVWTEPKQIEERLVDLAGHMEKVTQRYLRNDYASIEEYNAAAGEVAEPYRVVVIADFPAGFDEKSAGRLSGIATRGVPCGVLILICVDRDRGLPYEFKRADLDANALTLNWVEGGFVWDDADFGKFPLVLDGMPGTEISTPLLQKSAKAARDARRVEVPFEFIAPKDEDWWKSDSRAGVDLPLGKSGANKRQHLALGRGTSQHVLVAGRTGSGKSTLLHALITNVALNYSPDEVELYLIDFKKGVEFKVYVTQELPHASVVAIESEREFGISVLQRLDGELKVRGDRFRDLGVQDLNGYRNLGTQPPMPRILLVVDEFQEFFVEEDKLAQEAALLLDRLVRQGRAFGVHVILGSQTLGGAFTLARTTVGQMGVRIALQCSEADSHLILSESNTAARLLSRPGEAVYNDANGMVEGNHFFQVVWLSDERREAYLKRLRQFNLEHPPALKRIPIVFEGDAPAELHRNLRLADLLRTTEWSSSVRSAQAWVGEPVAIKDPTSVLFRRQGGNHLLIVGQNEEAAIGIIASTLVSLLSQFGPAPTENLRRGAKFFILDGTPEDHPNDGALARLATGFPQSIEVGSWRDTGRILGQIASEVERRSQPGAEDGAEIFLVIHDLPRFRDLRKAEDDFSFNKREEPATPADCLKSILREGSAMGVHVIAWCDNLNNLNRSFENSLIREFEMRILFQMSQNDSGMLLESPAASKLGAHRALFASEEQNRLEKFRPYKIPGEPWLSELKARLNARGPYSP